MIPLRLSVENFLCYREGVPTLDFAGIHLACLCGPNGHGKSALLDAITWCLWGRARGRTHDGLISYGADQCRVELDFLARDTRYRAVRTHARGGGRRRQGVTDLQLLVLGADTSDPITGNHIRETQAKIDQLVGMDYDTFINSAFLLQGRADEFSNKTSADRKAVLAKILGLEAYDRLQALARERLEESKTKAASIEGALEQVKIQIEQIGDLSAALEEVAERLGRLALQLAERRLENDELRNQVTELQTRSKQLGAAQTQLQIWRQEITQFESAMEMGQTRIQQFQALIAEAEKIHQGVERLEEARQRLQAQEEARQAYDELSQTKTQLVRVIDSGRSRLEAQAEQLRLKVEVELPSKVGGEKDLVDQQESTRRRLDTLDKEEPELTRHREHHRTLSTRIGEAKSVAERYKAEGLELGSKLELLRRTEHQGAVCPLCQTPLGEDGCDRLAETYEADIAEKRRLYRLNASQLAQLEIEQSAIEQDLTKREKALDKARREAELKLSELTRGVEEARQAQKDLEQSGAQLAGILKSLSSGNFAADEQAQLQRLETKVESLGYDEEARKLAYSQVQEWQPFTEKFRQLLDAENSLPRERESVAQAEEMLLRRRTELTNLEARHKLDQEAIASLPQWQAKLKGAEVVQKRLEDGHSEAIARRGFLEGQLLRLDRLRQEITQSSARLTELQTDQGIFQELVTAFGRQGVQAMLIETVVPRLEEEANNLLGRMTDNRMHLKLETQRERRTGRGDPIETLEIHVSDELGPRSYEMYSGGEAFRVNLALRIGLSRILAHRMGAPLPTLFIDEGFGTQDASGRERILDVIGAIQDDFDKIIVITHLDELKDAFPVRIEVQKEDRGSTFWLS